MPTTKPFQVVAVEKDGVVRIASKGGLTALDTRPMGVNPLQNLLGTRWSSNYILLNLARTPSMDSAAIGWLIESSRQCRAGGGALLVHSLSPQVRRTLELLKLDKVIALLADEN